MNKVTERNLNMSGIGWKVFKLYDFDEKHVMGEYHDGLFRFGRWESKGAYPPDLARMESVLGYYECGFHVFETEEGAKCWKKGGGYGMKIFKVKYRHGRVRGCFTGWDVPMPCIVADEILVLKEV